MELITPTEAQRLLAEHGVAPRKAAGQNFVIDPNTVRKIVRDAGVTEADTVLEIGPGLGSLTRALVDACQRVVAVEIDSGLVKVLRATIPDAEVVHADAMKSDLAELVDGGPAILVANLPYNLATPIVAHALAAGAAIPSMYVMVQREVGQRWAAGVGDPLYAGISIKIALVAEVEVAATVSRQVFLPVPNVDSVMVRIRRRPDALDAHGWESVSRVVETAFAQRRKTLRRTLRPIADPAVIEEACARAGIDPGARAQELTAEQFVALTAELS